MASRASRERERRSDRPAAIRAASAKKAAGPAKKHADAAKGRGDGKPRRTEAAKGRSEPYLVPEAAPRASAVAPEAGTAFGKYVYCIIQSSQPQRFGPIGLGTESEVYTVSYRDLVAVVSDTPMGVQDPTRENVLAHQRVNETVMRDHTVLPMSFGTVFKTNDDIVELLRSAYDAFADVLAKMHDKFEFGLKVLWDRDVVVRQIEEEDEDIRRLKNEISSQKGSTYFARMQYGRLIDAALQARSEQYVSEIFSALRDVSIASRSNKPIGDKMILNAAFLVGRAKEAEFDARVKDIGARYDNLTFKYTGPWPPYNFVNIRLKLERAQ